MVLRSIGMTGTEGQRPVPSLVQVTPELRTASPAEADRSPREGGACLLGEPPTLRAEICHQQLEEGEST